MFYITIIVKSKVFFFNGVFRSKIKTATTISSSWWSAIGQREQCCSPLGKREQWCSVVSQREQWWSAIGQRGQWWSAIGCWEEWCSKTATTIFMIIIIIDII